MTLVISLLFLQSLETGVAQFHRGEYVEAKQTLTAAPQSDTRDVFLALAQAATGQCSIARPVLERSYKVPELSRLAGLGHIQCLLAQDRVNDALAIAKRLETQFPSDPDVLYQSARLHMRAFNDTVNQMFQKAPSSYRVNQLSGEIFELQGRNAEAIAEYRKAIAKNPAALNLHYRLGRRLALESQLEEARREFEAELKLNPSDALAEYQMAQILAVQQNQAEAAKHYERALSLKPDFVEAMVALAKLRPASAIELLEKATTIAPRNEAARYALMLAYRNAGRLEDAQKQKAELDRLQRPPDGEFTEFLKKLGEKPKQ
ncbi:MAG TPA: tetratricopeptide repeat protein [Bryobacteraceae bacterium]|jgi:tetratricopeptide (TPR) repeat protein|nr:tetratricopeptide repeat protein [Bryobacteraceae bacterium]